MEPTAETVSIQPDTKRVLKWMFWSGTFFSLLIFFTLLKLPDNKIKDLIQGHILTVLATQNMSLTTDEPSRFSVLLFRYKMKGVHFHAPPPAPELKLDEVILSPTRLGLLAGRVGGSLWLKRDKSRISADLVTNFKMTKFKGSVDLDNVDLIKLPLLNIFTGMKTSAIVNGNAQLNAEDHNPVSASGAANLKLKNILIDQQMISGFNIPKLSISEGNANLTIKDGRFTIKSLKLGKPGSVDDLVLTATGDMAPGRTWESGMLNLKLQFKLSERLIKAFPILDAILASYKQADGSYQLALTGPLYSPTPSKLMQ